MSGATHASGFAPHEPSITAPNSTCKNYRKSDARMEEAVLPAAPLCGVKNT